jgi:AcrR family transcriptional regulator
MKSQATEASEEATRRRIRRATLVAAGELGYPKLTVAVVLERYGGYRLQFYRHFANVADCYAAAWAAEAHGLERRLLAAGAAAADWRSGLGAALAELALFCREDPALAGGLLTQVHVAGGATLGHRQEMLERLSRAIDTARRQTGSRHSPPPLTARFMVSAIEATVAKALLCGKPERLEAEMPELEALISRTFYGL